MNLLEELDVRNSDLIDVLYQENVLNPQEKESISCKRTTKEQIQELVNVLQRKTIDCYHKFLDALDRTEQHHIREMLCGSANRDQGRGN